MRWNNSSMLAAVALVALPHMLSAQADESSRTVAGGGVMIPGWTGVIDAKETAAGMKLTDAKLSMEGNVMKVVTGPAVTYWNPANKAMGDYTITATFTEPEYMNVNSHPHPYGLVMAGSDLGTATQSYLYCAAYGDGKFIVRGMGPEPFQMNGRGETNAAVNKAAAKMSPVTQKISMSVKGDNVTCSINDTVVGTYAKSSVIGAGKLKTTDGMYGMRFGHNTDATVTGLTITKP